MKKEKLKCLINESECGREAGSPVCPKCGMDERVVYPSEEDRKTAEIYAHSCFEASRANHELEVIRLQFVDINERLMQFQAECKSLKRKNSALQKELSFVRVEKKRLADDYEILNQIKKEFLVLFKAEALREIAIGIAAVVFFSFLLVVFWSTKSYFLPTLFLIMAGSRLIESLIKYFLLSAWVYPVLSVNQLLDNNICLPLDNRGSSAWQWLRSKRNELSC